MVWDKKSVLSSGKLYVSLALTFILVSSCTKKENDPSREIISPLPGNTVIYKFNGGEIKASDVEDEVAPRIEGLRNEVLNLYQKKAEALLVQRLLDLKAQKAGAGKAGDLLATAEVTDDQVKAYIKANKLQMDQKDAVKTFLQGQMDGLKKQQVVHDLLTEANVQSVLGSARYDSGSISGIPAKGSDNAKVVVQEFCDFQNPLCSRARVLMEELLVKYKDSFKMVFRHLPVDSNPAAKTAAFAAICADKQSRFWEAHDALYNSQAALTIDKIPSIVEPVLNDRKTFEDCLKSNDTKAALSRDLSVAKSLDISSTPTFLVNGARISDLEELRLKVDQELTKKK